MLIIHHILVKYAKEELYIILQISAEDITGIPASSLIQRFLIHSLFRHLDYNQKRDKCKYCRYQHT